MSDSVREIHPITSLDMTLSMPPDKSITHRAYMIASIAQGKSLIENPSLGMDCTSTRACLAALGVHIEDTETGVVITGRGGQCFVQPDSVLDAGNSGSTIRMLSGILAGQPIEVKIDGDASLRKRPMKRIADPLRLMGADVIAHTDPKGSMVCPLIVRGRERLKAITWELPVASAQVKTAVLFAGLHAEGRTAVREPYRSRDHTERMLEIFSCPLERTADGTIAVNGPAELAGTTVRVPGDFSSASFFIALACMIPNAEITVQDVGINQSRTGLLNVLRRMGAKIRISNRRIYSNEPVGDITVISSSLTGTVVEADEVPCMIDEVPVLAVVAATANGKTVIRGAGELMHKESNRLTAIAENLRSMNARITCTNDGLVIDGSDHLTGAEVDSFHDHRIAMAMAIAGSAAAGITRINNPSCVEISFPDFWEMLPMNTS
ncbi:MAG: 3-phosphoshikimate 1-carboxyvinyltransferase [Elusimicrobia bacterium]|nr:3-phosphoshikimate 1-carboxyvinyltransferase [Elusimicrobiota bacterium]MBD3412374.1 3-phosphoshikimate 1-carboxyvinyltransferase [Elusimicrobiota bacterium]